MNWLVRVLFWRLELVGAVKDKYDVVGTRWMRAQAQHNPSQALAPTELFTLINNIVYYE